MSTEKFIATWRVSQNCPPTELSSKHSYGLLYDKSGNRRWAKSILSLFDEIIKKKITLIYGISTSICFLFIKKYFGLFLLKKNWNYKYIILIIYFLY